MVSSLGRVWSVPRLINPGAQGQRWITGRIRVQTVNPATGYTCVWLPPPAGPRPVHRLVGAAFLGPLSEGMETRHLDGNRLNSRLDNLRYGTRSENRYDQIAHGTHTFGSRTHCANGHEYTEENTRWRTKDGERVGRVCRTCSRDQRRDYVERNRELINSKRRKK